MLSTSADASYSTWLVPAIVFGALLMVAMNMYFEHRKEVLAQREQTSEPSRHRQMSTISPTYLFKISKPSTLSIRRICLNTERVREPVFRLQ
jgi:hypothetical protein